MVGAVARQQPLPHVCHAVGPSSSSWLGVHAGRQFPDPLNRSLTYGSAVVAILALAVYHTRAGAGCC